MKTISIPQLSIHSGNLILVNQLHPCREEDIKHTLVAACQESSGVLMEKRAVSRLSRLMEHIDGWAQITAVSGWRSKEEQRFIYSQALKENGTEFTRQFVALPRHSEHQTGLAIDLGLKQPDIDFIRPAFPYSGICQTFRNKAPLFGFIERYPAGKEAITGIAHEPWHFRYVGLPHSIIMTKLGYTLEEYIAFLKHYPYGIKGYEYRAEGLRIVISYLKAGRRESTQLELDSKAPYSISGNNTDGFIITEWKEG